MHLLCTRNVIVSRCLLSAASVFAGCTDVNSYCIIKCEGKSVKLSVVRNSSQPEWNTAAVFYRKSPADKPVTFEVSHCYSFYTNTNTLLTVISSRNHP